MTEVPLGQKPYLCCTISPAAHLDLVCSRSFERRWKRPAVCEAKGRQEEQRTHSVARDGRHPRHTKVERVHTVAESRALEEGHEERAEAAVDV